MLGRLLHLGSGASTSFSTAPSAANSRPVSSLESVQEDIHTRGLLFPDAQALFQHRNDQVFPLSANSHIPSAPATSTSFDYSEDVDLDVRDVRVLIMQDTVAHVNTALLYDSHPVPTSQQSTERPLPPDPRRMHPPSRKGSLGHASRPLVIPPDISQPRPGAFDRRSSLHGRAQAACIETETQKMSREYREELATFSSCIFGHSELMSYKGTSTKVHVVPADSPRNADHLSSGLGDGRSSIGRSSARSSKLSQSFTSNTFMPPGGAAPPVAPTASAPSPRAAEKKKVLITRLFPVNITSSDFESDVTPMTRLADDSSGFPFPAVDEDPTAKKKTMQPRQIRTPMYAVVLVIQLPSARTSTTATPKSVFRESGSYGEQDFFSSSFNSSRPSWWNPTPDTANASCAIDVEDRIDALTQHWDIVMRTLTHLQSVVATTLRILLKQTDVSSPDSYAAQFLPTIRQDHRGSPDRRSTDNIRVKTPKSTQKLLFLSPNCLSSDVVIAAEVNIARRRIVTGVKASRVVTGQGRWGIWRDEAIWTSKWAQSQGNFIHSLFTGFLATHTDWLQTLSPPFYRRRCLNSRQNRAEEDLSLPARTVIVSEDKMAARRLIFLLSAFLPANQQLPANRVHRASISASSGGFGNSPPTFVIPVLREESLRRKINKRTGGNRRASHSAHCRTTSQSARCPFPMGHLGMGQVSERRASDAASIRTTSLAMPGNDMISRKSTAAITTTIMPETTMPHFSSAQRVDSSRRPRPESSDSVAKDDLRRSLKRGESSGHASTTSNDSRTSRWGSAFSSLWSPRRRESTSMNSLGESRDPKSPTKAPPFRRDKLTDMVREAALLENESAIEEAPGTPTTGHVTPPRDPARQGRASFAQLNRTPEQHAVVFESPVKTSVNEDDGVIDVDFPFPEYIASFESAISSPSSSGYMSTPGIIGSLDYFEQSVRVSVESDAPLNAAGWLHSFHPDFALQAIPPQDDLMDQVKATLRAEPTPALPPQALQDPSLISLPHRWVDVGSTIVADTTTNTVGRITLRRLVKQKSFDKTSNGNTIGASYPAIPQTPSVAPYETHIEEEWIEEKFYKPDHILVEAMEKVTGFNTDPIKEQTVSLYQTKSETTNGDEAKTATPELFIDAPLSTLEVPRVQCKTIILSALEEIIRHAIDRHERRTDRNMVTAGHHSDSVIYKAVREWLSKLDNVELPE